MMHSFSKNRRGRGFTLLEVLLASMMMAILLGVLWTLYISANDLRERSGVIVSEREAIARARVLLQSDLLHCMPAGGVLAGDFAGVRGDAFTVRRDSIAFYAASARVSDDAPGGDVQWVRYALKEIEYNHWALGRETQGNLLATIEETGEPEILLKHVQSLVIGYYDGTSWLDSWDSSTQDGAIPDAVSIRIVFAADPEDSESSVPAPLQMVIATAKQAPAQGTESEEEEGEAS